MTIWDKYQVVLEGDEQSSVDFLGAKCPLHEKGINLNRGRHCQGLSWKGCSERRGTGGTSHPGRIERSRKPRECPACGHAPLASILYGEPAFSERLARELHEGRTTLGGCCEEIDSPVWECTQCGVKIFRGLIESRINYPP
jgi:hypothetical protein